MAGETAYYVNVGGTIIPNPQKVEEFRTAVNQGFDALDLQKWGNVEDAKKNSTLFSRLAAVGINDPRGLLSQLQGRVSIELPQGTIPATDFSNVPREYLNQQGGNMLGQDATQTNTNASAGSGSVVDSLFGSGGFLSNKVNIQGAEIPVWMLLAGVVVVWLILRD